MGKAIIALMMGGVNFFFLKKVKNLIFFNPFLRISVHRPFIYFEQDFEKKETREFGTLILLNPIVMDNVRWYNC